MGFQDITYLGRVLRPRRTISVPDFSAETVLVSDPWEYVDLWLKREKKSVARAHWEQARHFAAAAETLPATSAPLPAYYCFLNAAKALLNVKGYSVAASHGVRGSVARGGGSLEAEQVHFQPGGALAGLCSALGEEGGKGTYSLKDALYNLPFGHRAFCLTFTSATELFIPVKNCRFVRKRGSREAWFCAEVEARYANRHTETKLPVDWEFEKGQPRTVRMKTRFRWEGRKAGSAENLARLSGYHQKVRRHIQYIYGPERLWYLKRGNIGTSWLARSPLTLTFAIMHRLSELSRYEPMSLSRHLERQHNWLLSEFIAVAPRQFIDEMASEITGCDFMMPGIRR